GDGGSKRSGRHGEDGTAWRPHGPPVELHGEPAILQTADLGGAIEATHYAHMSVGTTFSNRAGGRPEAGSRRRTTPRPERRRPLARSPRDSPTRRQSRR